MVFSSKDTSIWVIVLGRLIRLVVSPINLTGGGGPFLFDRGSGQATGNVTQNY